jgi:hypothetical protein
MVGGHLGFKTKYGATMPRDDGGGKVSFHMTNRPDAYVLASGEWWVGGCATNEDRDGQVVQPIDPDELLAAWNTRPPSSEEVERLQAECTASMQTIAEERARAEAAEARNTRLQALVGEKLTEADGCFEAAYIEGLSDVMAESHDERLLDLLRRRILYTRTAVQEAMDILQKSERMSDQTREIPCGACGTAIVVPDDIADDAEDGDYVICGLCALKNGDLKDGFVQ